MPTIIGAEKCPLMHHDEVAESCETELCNLDDSEGPLDCNVYQAIRKRLGIGL